MNQEDIKRKRLNFVWTQQEAIDAIMHGLTKENDEAEVRSLLEGTIGLAYAVGSLETIRDVNDTLQAGA
jgi:hypothetical protein